MDHVAKLYYRESNKYKDKVDLMQTSICLHFIDGLMNTRQRGGLWIELAGRGLTLMNPGKMFPGTVLEGLRILVIRLTGHHRVNFKILIKYLMHNWWF